ncbi:MAG: hypothetical protein Tp1100SUR763771_29 [Prokaryotic dsDNA virus sp.]|nr:MAG: hypothetical protein Tp1100SUR763771_29 [Prokaryotic dsDNA virus sp.]
MYKQKQSNKELVHKLLNEYNNLMENLENKENALITFNNVEYKASDLTDQQRGLAIKLRTIAKQLNNLEEAYNMFLILNDVKSETINAFERSLNDKQDENSEAKS